LSPSTPTPADTKENVMTFLSRIARYTVSAAALLFAGIGLEFWIAPAQAAARFGLEAAGAAGTDTLRADMGGLFLGLALLCAAGTWAKRRAALVAAALLLGTVVAGRTLGWILEGRADLGGARAIVVEIAALAALLAGVRTFGGPGAPARRKVYGLAWVVGVALVVTVAAAAAALLTPRVQQQIFDRAALQMSARTNAAPLEDDALRLAVCGSSAPLPSADRAKACVAVFAGGKYWVVDSGPESTENLVLWGIPLAEIGGVLLTHFHSDHIGDLGELHLQTWAGGRREPLAVYGGPGVEGVVAGFNQAYALDQGYRTEHHGEKVMPSTTWGMVAHTVELDGEPTPALDRRAVVYDDGALKITALEVDHAPIAPAYAYRFDYRGRSAVVTGDLKNHPPLVDGAAGADLLLSEAISRTMTQSLEDAAHSVERERTAAIMHDVQDYHISPEEAAAIANDAGVKLLVFYHLLPAPDGFLPRQLFAQGVDAVRRGDWTMADDGSLYTLPLGSRDIRIGRIDG
jgi:ribonuclease Z